MVIYLDLVFLINCIADALALYVTSRLSGMYLCRSRMILASLLGGIYGVICLFPVMNFIGAILPQILMAAFLVWLVFGKQVIFVRLLLLFFVLSCAIGGVMIAFAHSFEIYGGAETFHNMNWNIFFLAGGLCYFLLSVVFKGGASHAIFGQMSIGKIFRNNRSSQINILTDTGHTLYDPLTDAPVMTVWLDALRNIWTADEWRILLKLNANGAVWCYEELIKISPTEFHLIPYHAVGIERGTLLCFSAEKVIVDHCSMGRFTIAISPTPLSDGGSCNALWGGNATMERKENLCL